LKYTEVIVPEAESAKLSLTEDETADGEPFTPLVYKSSTALITSKEPFQLVKLSKQFLGRVNKDEPQIV